MTRDEMKKKIESGLPCVCVSIITEPDKTFTAVISEFDQGQVVHAFEQRGFTTAKNAEAAAIKSLEDVFRISEELGMTAPQKIHRVVEPESGTHVH